MAAGIADLDLPVLAVPDLFLTQKLITPSPAQIALSSQSRHINSSPRIGPAPCPASVPTPLALPALDQSPGATPDLAVEAESSVLPRRPSIPSSYSSAVLSRKRVSTPDVDSSGSTTSEASDDLPERSAPTFTRSKHVNPSIVSLMLLQCVLIWPNFDSDERECVMI